MDTSSQSSQTETIPSSHSSTQTEPIPGPSRPIERKKSANYSDKQRHWMFAFICQARGLLNLHYNDKSIHLFTKAQELISNHLDMIGLAAPPSLKALRVLWTSFEKTNEIVRIKKPSGRKKKDIRQEVEFASSQNLSVREISQQLSTVGVPVSKSSVQRVLKKEFKMRFYRSPEAQLLSPAAVANRFLFGAEIQSRMMRGAIDINDICFTDECYVGTGPSSNRQNDGYWRLAGDSDPEQHLKQREFQGDRIHIFVAIHPKAGIIGPIFVDELDCPEDTTHTTLTAKRYCFMLRTIVIPELKRRLGDDFDRCWFQQDGAAPHTAAISRQYLREVFGGRLISLREDLMWPPYSPDLSPLDYWFWYEEVDRQRPSSNQRRNQALC